MSIMCHPACKHGIPIPFVGYVCIGVSILCNTTGQIGEAITDTSGGNAGGNCQKPQCSIQGIYPSWYEKAWE